MRIIDWLKDIVGGETQKLPVKSFIPLLADGGDEQGAIIIHDDETRDILLKEFAQSRTDFAPHGGSISSYFADQLGVASGLVASALQSRQLLQVVGATPNVIANLNKPLSLMRSAGQMTGTVISKTSNKIVGQLRFAPANIPGIVGPMVIWQILNAVAGVSHLQRINDKLEALQRGIERLTIRLQAKTYGQLISAVRTLEELSQQFDVTGTFSMDMTVKLALAERDIRAGLAEQRVLVQRFNEKARLIINESKGKAGALLSNQVLKEESPEFFMDAKLLTAASRASILASQAWIRHDLEHNPRHIGTRLRDLQSEMAAIRNTIYPLEILGDLDRHATACLNEMDWFSRNIFNRSLKHEIQSRDLSSERETNGETIGTPSVVIWNNQNNETKSVVIDVEAE